jgi:hypothetical protein
MALPLHHPAHLDHLAEPEECVPGGVGHVFVLASRKPVEERSESGHLPENHVGDRLLARAGAAREHALQVGGHEGQDVKALSEPKALHESVHNGRLPRVPTTAARLRRVGLDGQGLRCMDRGNPCEPIPEGAKASLIIGADAQVAQDFLGGLLGAQHVGRECLDLALALFQDDDAQ